MHARVCVRMPVLQFSTVCVRVCANDAARSRPWFLCCENHKHLPNCMRSHKAALHENVLMSLLYALVLAYLCTNSPRYPESMKHIYDFHQATVPFNISTCSPYPTNKCFLQPVHATRFPYTNIYRNRHGAVKAFQPEPKP